MWSILNDYFAEEVESHNGDHTEDVDQPISNTILTNVEQTGSNDTVSDELDNSKVLDNELDRKLDGRKSSNGFRKQQLTTLDTGAYCRLRWNLRWGK